MKINLKQIKEYLDQGHSIEEAQEKFELSDELVEKLIFSIIEDTEKDKKDEDEVKETKKSKKESDEDDEDEVKETKKSKKESDEDDEDEDDIKEKSNLPQKYIDKAKKLKGKSKEEVQKAMKDTKSKKEEDEPDDDDEDLKESMSIKALEKTFEKDILPDLGRNATTNQKKEAWREFVETLKQAGSIDSRVARAELPKRFEEVDVEALQAQLSEMSQEQLKTIFELINDPIMASIKKIQKDVTTVSEESDVDVTDLNTLINESESFSEEFKEKASILFEAAVSEKVETKLEAYKAEVEERITEEVKNNFTMIVEKVDKYLTSEVEAWINENDEKVTAGLRVEIAESFIDNLKSLFEKHYIEMPEAKRNLFDEITAKAAELEEKYEKQSETLLETSARLNNLQREKIIQESSEGLYDTQVEKLKKLTENVEFADADEFERKVKLIKTTYFSRKNDDGLNEEDDKDVEIRRRIIEEKEENDMSNSVMGKYVTTISRHAKR